MKNYFKYDNGYVNINDENLFLTNSGNWSETYDLWEKSPKSIKQNNFKSNKINLFLFLIICIGLLMISKAKNAVLPLGFISLGIAAFFYIKRETGKRYKIPILKIIKIEVVDNSVKIIFYNANNQEDFEEITNVEFKGLGILEELTQHLERKD